MLLYWHVGEVSLSNKNLVMLVVLGKVTLRGGEHEKISDLEPADFCLGGRLGVRSQCDTRILGVDLRRQTDT
jgi:hypothetical protein